MPFKALLRSTGRTVTIWELDGSPRAVLSPGDLECPHCGADMFVRCSVNDVWHFVHQTKCEPDLGSHPESTMHDQAKHAVRRWLLRSLREELKSADVEVPIPEAGRIADVLITWTKGWRQAHEVQLAGTTPRELDERTQAYRRNGIDVYWWLGSQALNEENRDYCLKTIGDLGEIHWRDATGISLTLD